MMIDGVERGAFDKIRYDITEKLSGLNKSFETSLKPENDIFGITEIDKGGGCAERSFRDEFNNLHKEYYQDGVLTKTREKIDAKTWCTTSFDDNGSAYVKQFNERTKNGLTAKRMELIPGVEVKKANFTAQIDELGRPVVNKITDLQKMPGREALSEALKDDAYKVSDERGHIIADIFGGPASKENIVPQSYETNHVDMKRAENYVLDLKAKNPDAKIDYEVKVNYDGKSKRPSSFEPKVTVDGKVLENVDELKKIYNNTELTQTGKMVTTAKEHLNKATTKAMPFHKAGVEEGLEAAAITFAVSTVDNVSQFMDGDITAEDMVINIAKDTGTAGAAGYATGFVTKVIATSMQNSTNTMLQSLGNLGVPAAVVSFGVESYDTIMDFAQGEIDGLELAYDLGENAASVAGSAAGAALAGAAVGSIIPGAGTAVGFIIGGGASIVGGMVGTAVATGAYKTAIEMGTAGAEVLADKAQEMATKTIDAAKECLPGAVDDVRGMLNTFLAQNEMPFSI